MAEQNALPWKTTVATVIKFYRPLWPLRVFACNVQSRQFGLLIRSLREFLQPKLCTIDVCLINKDASLRCQSYRKRGGRGHSQTTRRQQFEYARWYWSDKIFGSCLKYTWCGILNIPDWSSRFCLFCILFTEIHGSFMFVCLTFRCNSVFFFQKWKGISDFL